MEQHPVPRQITSFEFKLIGFMTLKQFILIISTIPIGFIMYFLTPIPLLRELLGFLIAISGTIVAFVPVNDRPMDVFVKNLYKRLTSPTQYTYQKNNAPVSFLQNLYFLSDPHHVFSHIDSEEKLSKYMADHQAPVNDPGHPVQRVQSVKNALQTASKTPVKAVSGTRAPQVAPAPAQAQAKPFMMGVVRTRKEVPIPGLLIYIKDSAGRAVRLLKTNPNGVFATYSVLPPAEYVIEVKDPKNNHFFDTIKIRLPLSTRSLEIISRELL